MEARSSTRLVSLFALCVALVGCVGEGSVTALNPLTGEEREFSSEADVPVGWIVCADDGSCPAPRSCAELDEASCLARTDCSPVYVGIGAYPRECEGPNPPALCGGEGFAGCTEATSTCDDVDCGPMPLGASYLCEDGSVGGVTGRCIAHEDGACGWERRDCPPPPPEECAVEACGPAPGAPAYECPDGSIGGNTGRCLARPDGTCGWELRECPTEVCPAIGCDVVCPEGTASPVDENGCVDSCRCEPLACTAEECGPAPGAPAYMCADGSWGGNIGLCARSPEGTCGWVFRSCPPDSCEESECGPALGAPTILCEDGSTGGNTGRCLLNADGTCGWELRECPDLCARIPECDLACAPGTHNPIDENGCTRSCECVPDEA